MVTSESLRSELAAMPAASADSAKAVAERAASVLRPPGALANLDRLATWIATWHVTATPSIEHPVALVFAADHGVAGDGVSAYPADITAAMLAAVRNGQASINALAESVGATVAVTDVGVGRPTANLRHEPAMTTDRFAEAFDAGRRAVAEVDADLIVLGELGIGNTTAAAAVTAAVLGAGVDQCVGRGTGVDDDGLALKQQVVSEALERISDVSDPIEKLRHVGGAELAAMAGAMVETRARRIPVLLDGYICTAPALVLHAVATDLVAHLRAGHRSAEPGHRLALDALELEPIVTLDLRLGEGSGAMVAVPIVAAACRAVTHVATFDEFFGAE